LQRLEILERHERKTYMSLKLMVVGRPTSGKDYDTIRNNYCTLLEGLQKITKDRSIPDKVRSMAQDTIDKAGEKFTPEMPFVFSRASRT
jgi:hypothetical protein